MQLQKKKTGIPRDIAEFTMYTVIMKRIKAAPSRLAGLFLIFILASCASSAETTGAAKNPVVIDASAPLRLYRTDKPDSRVTVLSQSMASGFQKSADPEKALRDFTRQLVQGENDPYMKIKLIHDWITLSVNYDVAMLERGVVTGQDIRTVLSARKAVCSGYSKLFETMASAAGFEAKTIHGWARGLSGNFEFTPRNSHAWNMVNISGQWLFLDTTFDAGAFTDGRYKQRYSTDYLFPGPEQLQYTHFPEDPSDQLMSRPIDRSRFINQALFLPEFFKLGLSVPAVSANPGQFMPALVKAADRYNLDFEAPPDVMLDASVFSSDGGEIGGSVMLSLRAAGKWRISFAFPKAGTYKALIFAGKTSTREASGSTALPGKSEEKLKSVLSFAFQTSGKNVEFPAFPRQYASFFERAGEYLESPITGVLKAGMSAKFVYISNAKKVSLIHDGNFIPLEENPASPGRFELELKVPKTELLKLGVSEDGVNFSIMLSWSVR